MAVIKRDGIVKAARERRMRRPVRKKKGFFGEYEAGQESSKKALKRDRVKAMCRMKNEAVIEKEVVSK